MQKPQVMLPRLGADPLEEEASLRAEENHLAVGPGMTKESGSLHSSASGCLCLQPQALLTLPPPIAGIFFHNVCQGSLPTDIFQLL